MRIYENTHPPLSKLLVTLSVMLFGGLRHRRQRVGLALPRRAVRRDRHHRALRLCQADDRLDDLCRDRIVFLDRDGMHFVQSRIATPEGFVIVFSLAAVYAFYRFWIASQVEERAHMVVPPWAFGVARRGFESGVRSDRRWRMGSDLDVRCTRRDARSASSIIVALYVAVGGVYLLFRYVFFRRWFADGSARIHVSRRRLRARSGIEPYALRARRRHDRRLGRRQSQDHRGRVVAEPLGRARLSGRRLLRSRIVLTPSETYETPDGERNV